MKMHLCVLLAAPVLLCLAFDSSAQCQQAGVSFSPTSPIAGVYFSPRGGCTAAIVREIAAAKQSVRMQAYSFTSAPIAIALSEARKRGVSVVVIVDSRASVGLGSMARTAATNGVTVLIDGAHAIAHNKVLIVDGSTLITGSFNWTAAAEEHNAENMIIVRDAPTAAAYTANWTQHAAHSRVFVPIIPIITKELTHDH